MLDLNKELMTKQYIKGLVTMKENGTFSAVASTATIDRQGDSIDQSGWELANFKKNPVILWAHDYSQMPVARADEIGLDDNGNLVIQLGTFASPEANPFAQQVKAAYEEGILGTMSVGFIPKERNGNIITRSELLEVSFVPVPANPEALTLAMTKGLDNTILEAMKHAEGEEKKEPEEGEEEKDDAPTCSTHEMPLEYCQKCVDGMKTAEHEAIHKQGKVLSAANEKKVTDAISSLKGTLAVLEELLAASSPSEDGKAQEATESKEALERSKAENEVVISADTLKDLRSQLRVNDKHTELAIGVINRLLAKNK